MLVNCRVTTWFFVLILSWNCTFYPNAEHSFFIGLFLLHLQVCGPPPPPPPPTLSHLHVVFWVCLDESQLFAACVITEI